MPVTHSHISPRIRRIAGFCVWLTLVLAAPLVFAQEVFRVVDVAVEGNRASSASLILGVANLNPGSYLSPITARETIERLYGLGIFEDVRLDIEDVAGGIRAIIVVRERPKLTALEFSGSDRISHKDLREKLGLGVGGYISPYLVYQKQKQIETMYADKGYFRATATPELVYSADSTEATLSYKVNARSKVKVDSVIMTGTARVPVEKVVGRMRNRKRGLFLSSTFVQDKYDEDLKRIVEFYHKRGFADAYVVSDSQVVDTAANTMRIFVEVYEGPLYYFGRTTFSGNEKLSTDELQKSLKHAEGEIFNAEVFDRSSGEVSSAYYDIGHLNVRMFDNVTTRNDSLIDITYEITEGLPSKIRYIPIVGNNKTREKVIRRELPVLPGQTFNRALLLQSIRELMALNFFDQVVPEPISLPNGDVDLEIKVKEKATGSVNAGAGYNSQDKLVGNVGMTIPNFRGLGQNVGFTVEFGGRRNSLSLSFTEPWVGGRPLTLGADLYLTNRRWFDDYTEGRQGGSVRIGRRLREFDRYLRALAGYRLERNRYYDFSDDFVALNSIKTISFRDGGASTSIDTTVGGPYEGSLLEGDNKWRDVSNLTFTLTRDSRNLPEFATSGSRISYSYDIVGGPLGGFFNFQKHSITVAKFVPLIGQIALAARMQWGAISTSEGIDRVLLSDRFTPGGTAFDGTVRGYEDGDLTPRSFSSFFDTLKYFSDGKTEPDSIEIKFRTVEQRERGNYMLVSNLELQVPVIPRQLYLIGFFDAGNSWYNRRDIKPVTGLYKGYGAGFRLVVPGIGTLGFDFGYPMDDFRTQEKAWKPHFQIGTTIR